MFNSFTYANENYLHLIILSGKMQNIHLHKLNIPHQPAHIFMRSRMVELAMIYLLTVRLAFLLFYSFCELDHLLAVLMHAPESQVTGFLFSTGGTDWGKFCSLTGLQTLSSAHHPSPYAANQCSYIGLPLGEAK